MIVVWEKTGNPEEKPTMMTSASAENIQKIRDVFFFKVGDIGLARFDLKELFNYRYSPSFFFWDRKVLQLLPHINSSDRAAGQLSGNGAHVLAQDCPVVTMAELSQELDRGLSRCH